MPDYEKTVDRILAILQADDALNEMISEWRFGMLPEQRMAHEFPCIYVSVATNPEVERRDYGSTPEDGKSMPMQRIITEYYIVIVTSPAAIPEDAQRELYKIQQNVIRILRANLLLVDPSTGRDGLAQYLEISSQRRLTESEGKVMDSMTIMARATTYEDPITVGVGTTS